MLWLASPATAFLGDPEPCEGDCLYIEDKDADLRTDAETELAPEAEDIEIDPNDLDGDGFENDIDNCPSIANEDQYDTDEDGSGDACDGDDDGDLIIDRYDSCPYEYAIDTDDGCPIVLEPELIEDDVSTDVVLEANEQAPNIAEALDNGACSFIGGSKGSNIFIIVIFGLTLLPLAIRRKS